MTNQKWEMGNQNADKFLSDCLFRRKSNPRPGAKTGFTSRFTRSSGCPVQARAIIVPSRQDRLVRKRADSAAESDRVVVVESGEPLEAQPWTTIGIAVADQQICNYFQGLKV